MRPADDWASSRGAVDVVAASAEVDAGDGFIVVVRVEGMLSKRDSRLGICKDKDGQVNKEEGEGNHLLPKRSKMAKGVG